MESPLSETLLFMPQNYLIIELVQAVYLHIPVLLCQQQCLCSRVLFLFFSGFFFIHVTAIFQLIEFRTPVFFTKYFYLSWSCISFELVSNQWLYSEQCVLDYLDKCTLFGTLSNLHTSILISLLLGGEDHFGLLKVKEEYVPPP